VTSGLAPEKLRLRAGLLRAARRFFEARGVLEVETPVLCAAGAVDEHLEPIPVGVRGGGGEARAMCLVTSPEHSMKRLLAAGSGPIYQITRAFRDGERGRLHNPEFTILEWYRPGSDHEALMDEVEDLLRALVPEEALFPAGGGDRRFERLGFAASFQRALGVDPHTASGAELAAAARRAGVEPPPGLAPGDREAWIDLLLVTRVEPTLGLERPVFLTDYPAGRAALARVREGEPPVAERFELYARGLELANGYHELLDAGEQRRRFAEANRARARAGKRALPIDERFLAALEAGLPPAAGVAVGFDRVALLAAGASSIDEVLAFPFEEA
jgi:lysyl-tRNA synthetase class 2